MFPQVALRARYVFPVDGPPIKDGVVTVVGDRIGDVAILPGWVNSHVHLEFSDQEQPLGEPGGSFVDWIRQVIACRGQRDRDVSEAISRGIAECISSGTTSLGEIATARADDYPSPLDSIDVTLMQEVIGFSAARSLSSFGAVINRLNDFEQRHDMPLGLSPHAPYSVHPTLVDRLVEQSAKERLPLAMHLAESPEELQLLADGDGPFRELLEDLSMWDGVAIAPGTRPIDYLRRLARAERALVIHGNYLQKNELEFLAEQRERMTLVYCPRTHAYFGHPRYPLVDALAIGVRVALGTDSRVSNPDLNVWEEMRFVAREFPEVSPEAALRMITIEGAHALGRVDQVGSLAVGKAANLAIVSISPRRADSPFDLLCDDSSRVIGTWYRGRPVWPPGEQGE